ncbi:hypothetical protein FQN60_006723 [Etheostoma spectabile]|uniref:Uncharacterized protein n=1 Tax=Etheostoma spectabile TaxID=54343 RepID=A0A5J5CHM4_9PERO|nr:hypothetical protein FQN60_006723 [Etheostoma spectabile]
MEMDVRLLSDPGGRAVGGAWSLEGEESISQAAPPETTNTTYHTMSGTQMSSEGTLMDVTLSKSEGLHCSL